MDHLEEQANELEALKSIFFDEEFEELDAGPPASFRLLIKSEEDYPQGDQHDPSDFYEVDEDEADDEDDDQDAASKPPRFHLHITYTETYPDSAPTWSLESPKKLFPSDISEIHSHIEQLINENLGMAMVFTLHSGAREKLEDIVRAKVADVERAKEKRIEAEDAAEAARKAGTKVTQESFLAWREKFIKEMEVAQQQAAAVAAAAAGSGGKASLAAANKQAAEMKTRLTGRQLFEKDKSLARSDVALLADTDVTVEFDKALFEGEMDGLEDSDEENAVLAGFTEDDD